MSEKSLPVITISREYGAGGRTVARGLSEALGIPYYDNEFIEKTAEKSGYSAEDVEREGESMTHAGRIMNSILNSAVSYTSSSDGIFRAQKQVILDLAAGGPCILVGRCSNIILRAAGVPSFDIFLYAPMEKRIVRARELGECNIADIRKYISRRDDTRATYYKTYTGHAMGDYRDYSICLDTGAIGAEKCVELLVSALGK